MATVTCQNCGHGNPQGTAHCIKCGERLRNAPQQQTSGISPNPSYGSHSDRPIVTINHYEGGTFSQNTIAEALQKWANRLALISKVIFIIGIIVGLIVVLINIGTYSDNKEYLNYLGNTRYESLSSAAQKAFAAKNAISIGITCVVGSIIGLFLIPVMFGGLYAFGVHLQTNQELLVIQKELLALSKRAE